MIAPLAGKIVGLDSSRAILEKARTNIIGGKIFNIDLVEFVIQPEKDLTFPFAPETFDIVTFMLAPHDAKESFRVLKPGGVVLMERPGEMDKRKAKMLFGADGGGSRGYLCNETPGSLKTKHQQDFTRAGFGEVETRDGFWNTWYSRDGLIKVFSEARTVREFDKEKDKGSIDEVERQFGTTDGIKLSQHRILLIARK